VNKLYEIVCDEDVGVHKCQIYIILFTRAPESRIYYCAVFSVALAHHVERLTAPFYSEQLC
jgi:hypothetical protein